ncbi:DUF1566 domain-containing protein [Sulfurimonas sp. C5]|uniref:Lcl C-terminal domain-containing protein n=1 Tax=Sulfurimonas sp. C5 TaxID=3036947 RepID=UPI0024564499|nr:DUF1566 domain-containing protein [Sulfurimonas sp. C5]MDH4943818.1 DUF1566 domain-containing protein [Sulfurimonas sp. C5]
MVKNFFVVLLLVFSFSLNAQENTVKDTKNKLEWEDSNEALVEIWKLANGYCKQLQLAGHRDWRLPTKDELISLSKNTALKKKFHNFTENVFWSKDSDPKDEYNIFTIFSGNGFVSASDTCEEYATMCVRDLH